MWPGRALWRNDRPAPRILRRAYQGCRFILCAVLVLFLSVCHSRPTSANLDGPPIQLVIRRFVAIEASFLTKSRRLNPEGQEPSIDAIHVKMAWALLLFQFARRGLRRLAKGR